MGTRRSAYKNINKHMTYRDLLSSLDLFEDDQLDMLVMIDVDDEKYGVKKIEVQDGSDQLEDGHPYLII